MHYLLLLANAPDAWELTDPEGDPPTDDAPTSRASGGDGGEPVKAAVGPDDGVISDWAVYTRALQEAGVLIGGSALFGPETATSVQVRAGAPVLVDGPFAETKEHLIGFYVIDVPDLDAAIRWAARVPNVRTGTVEIRPIRPGSDTATVLAQ